MHLFLGTKRSELAGPDVIIDCLWCGKSQVTAHSRKQTEWLTLFHFLPLFPFRTIFVQCGACKKDMVATCSLEDLARSNPMTLKYHLVKRVSFVGRTCIVLGYLLCWAFCLGLIPAIIGYVYGRKQGGRMKKIALWGLILNILSPFIFFLLINILQFFTK